MLLASPRFALPVHEDDNGARTLPRQEKAGGERRCLLLKGHRDAADSEDGGYVRTWLRARIRDSRPRSTMNA